MQLSPWRGEELPLPGGGFVVNDAYNANPTSMEAALRHLAERGAGRRRLAILGGMAELGEHTERHHREIAELAGELGIEVIAVGELAHATARTPGAGRATALEAAQERVGPGDAVLVKASRSVALEGIAPTLANETPRDPPGNRGLSAARSAARCVILSRVIPVGMNAPCVLASLAAHAAEPRNRHRANH